jgi:Protein kinase domain
MSTPSPDPEATARIESDVRFTPRPRGTDAQFAPGRIIAERYRIASILGSGGMGEVYRADDIKLGQQVALKFLPARLARDHTLLERLMDEVRLGRQITHPNVCRIYDIVDWQDAHFVAMEYVDGEDLSRLLRRIGRLANDKAVEIARGIAAGLAAAHAKGILHRDLKPANVMIDSHGEARIMDFGLALTAGEDDGTISGTPAYMAPEQLEGQPASVQSDLYALGLVMYELFTGKRAHNARTLPERVRDLSSDITTPSSFIRDIDPTVERVILRCLSHDPAQRPRSAREVIAALPGGDPLAAAMAAGETPSPRFIAAAPIAGSLTLRNAWMLFGGIVAVATMILVLAVLSKQLGLLGLTKAPEIQAERARELLRALGIPAQKFDTYGFRENHQYNSWLDQHDRTPSRWDHTARSVSIVSFWLREQRTPIVNLNATSTPRPSLTEPPLTEPGAAAIEISPRGQLLSLTAVAEASWPERAPDWNAFLAAGGWRVQSLTPAAPRLIPPVFADARAAWSGTLEDGTPIGIEAAMARGVPVFFRVTGPWQSTSEWSMSFGGRFDFVVAFTLGIAVALGAILAYRNIRLRRGDRSGAIRVGAVVCVADLLHRLLVADHEASPSHEGLVFFSALSGALLFGALLALVYLALEPYLRRRWPDRLVSWSRLIAGNWRDPMIGRDIMIGLLAGGLHTSVITLNNLAEEWQARDHIMAAPGMPNVLARASLGAAHVAGAVSSAMLYALAVMMFLMLLSVVFRRRPVAIGGFFLLNLSVYLVGSMEPRLFPSYLLMAAMVTFVVARYGLLAAAAFQFAFGVTFFHPLPDAFAWYTLRAMIPMACLLALAVWAFRTSLGNQSPFGEATLDA